MRAWPVPTSAVRVEAGLRFRPLEETILDTLAWDHGVPGERPTLTRGEGGARSLRPPDRIRVQARAAARASTTARRSTAILDEALLCHLGFEVDGQPYVIPTLHARVGDKLYVHGSAASRMLRHAASGVPVCVTVTLFDGLVLARSVFNHSVNYRSVVVFGTATLVDGDEKREALRALTEQLAPGRWDEARQPTDEGAEGDVDPLAAARRGVGEGADGRRGGRARGPGAAGVGGRRAGAPRRRAERVRLAARARRPGRRTLTAIVERRVNAERGD